MGQAWAEDIAELKYHGVSGGEDGSQSLPSRSGGEWGTATEELVGLWGRESSSKAETGELVAEGCRCPGQESHSCGLASRRKRLSPFLGWMT